MILTISYCVPLFVHDVYVRYQKEKKERTEIISNSLNYIYIYYKLVTYYYYLLYDRIYIIISPIEIRTKALYNVQLYMRRCINGLIYQIYILCVTVVD